MGLAVQAGSHRAGVSMRELCQRARRRMVVMQHCNQLNPFTFTLSKPRNRLCGCLSAGAGAVLDDDKKPSAPGGVKQQARPAAETAGSDPDSARAAGGAPRTVRARASDCAAHEGRRDCPLDCTCTPPSSPVSTIILSQHHNLPAAVVVWRARAQQRHWRRALAHCQRRRRC